MIALLEAFWSKTWGYVVAGGAAVAAVLGVLAVAREDGEKAAQDADLKRAQADAQVAAKQAQRVEGMTSDEAEGLLRKKFGRPS